MPYNTLEKRRIYYRAWRASHKNRVREQWRRGSSARRARERFAFIEHIDPQTCYNMHGGLCGICKQFIGGRFHVDHIKPLAVGGLHCYANAQPAHPACNSRKHITYIGGGC